MSEHRAALHTFPEIKKKSSKELLLGAAKKLFSKHGFNGVTVRDLSKESGVSIGSLNYYFDGKEALYKECLHQFGLDELKMAERILQLPQNENEFKIRLKLFCEEMFSIHIREPELTTLIHRELDSDTPLVEDLFKKSFQKIQHKLMEFLEHSSKLGFTKSQINADIFSFMFMNTVIQYIRLDKIQFQYFGKTIQHPQHLQTVIEQMLMIFCDGIMKEKKGDKTK